jgi:transposase
MRVSTAIKRLLRLPGVTVIGVAFKEKEVEVTVALRQRRLRCPECTYTTKARYDSRQEESFWRHLDLGAWRLVVRASLRRLNCPDHGVRVEGVPFARARAHHTRDFDDLVSYLATMMDKTAICRLCRVDWDTVGRMITRVMDDGLDPSRLNQLFAIGVDDVSWRKGQKYLTLVSDHQSGKMVWGTEGRDAATLDQFFKELGPERSTGLVAVSMDMSGAYGKSVGQNAPNAIICFDPFHVVQLATKALDKVRREYWQEMRQLPDPEVARRFKGARWCLLKNPKDLTDQQAATLRKIRRRGGALWLAYTLKEALREIFAGDLDEGEVAFLLDRFCSRASRSGLKPFVTLSQTIRKHRAGILQAVRLGVNNARHEGLNRRVRLIINRAYGFHSARAALALVMLTLGPIDLQLPHERAG